MIEYISAGKALIDLAEKCYRRLGSDGGARAMLMVVPNEGALRHHLTYVDNWSADVVIGAGAGAFQSTGSLCA